ncbi:hypothetical protein [Hymenobacter sp. B81]|uniref:hypothetical protein n=1 Tax=Hymenobacter sp. B81 TaxID=3344878 RepID=UPI0037DD2D23
MNALDLLWQHALSLLFILLVSVGMYRMSLLGRADLPRVTGRVTRISTAHYTTVGQLVSARHAGSLRYLHLEGQAEPFELFVGTAPGDFSPALNRLAQLRTGDSISVYSAPNGFRLGPLRLPILQAQPEPVKQGVRFIDRGPESIFAEGNRKHQVLALCCWLTLSGVVFLLLVLRRRERESAAVRSLF